MVQKYNAPNNTASSIGANQIRTDFYKRKALVEAMHSQHFQPLADVTAMPKHYGKTIKQYKYIPLLDDRNVSDEGIDASTAAIQNSLLTVVLSRKVITYTGASATADATAAAAAINAIKNSAATRSGDEVTFTQTVFFDVDPGLAATAVADVGWGTYTRTQAGNLYGSSRDIGFIPDRFPALSETGGRVNRVGFTRVEIQGELQKYGFFEEFTQESLDFDSDEQLEEHTHREMLRGASDITEDMLQLDLINAVGITKYSGAATSIASVKASDRVTYGDLVRLGIELDKNLTPKKTTIITGSRMIDTRVIPAARLLFIGSELLPDLMTLKNFHNREAFIPVEQYGSAAGYLFNDEAGSIAGFRVIVNHKMLKHAGKGAEATPTEETSTYSQNGNVDVFPMLVIGDGSFTTIGFQGGRGGSSKFTVYLKKPGEGVADHRDPFGETGFMSIKWYYGFMALRDERIAVQWTAARY